MERCDVGSWSVILIGNSMTKNEILPFWIADGAHILPVDKYQKLTEWF